MSAFAADPRTESTHHLLYELAKSTHTPPFAICTMERARRRQMRLCSNQPLHWNRRVVVWDRWVKAGVGGRARGKPTRPSSSWLILAPKSLKLCCMESLTSADIGLSMGIQGTEVAKESSDIIILDDNFASVVKVVRWGRSVYANIQKFIQFQLTVNVAALVINVVAAVTSGDVPLNAVQLLWVNLIMDTLGALALATEPPTDHLMHRSPVGRREPLITNIMWRNLLIQALYQVGVLLVLNFRGKSILNLHGDSVEHATEVKNTMIFNSFVLCQVFNEFNARKPDEINVFRGVSKNHLFVGIVGFTVILQIILIEFSGKFTSTVKLSWQLWLASVAIGLVSWPLAAVGKLIPVPKTPLHVYLSKPFRRLRPARNS